MGYLLLGTAVVWLGTFLYVISLVRRQNKAQKMLIEIRKMLEND